MVTAIHVVDTLEPTQSLPHVAAIPLSLSLSLSAASLRAWQGHSAVSYYKRSSPSLLQETQTHQSCALPHPTPTPALITHSASGSRRPGRHTHTHTHTKWTNTEQQNLERLSLMFMFTC